MTFVMVYVTAGECFLLLLLLLLLLPLSLEAPAETAEEEEEEEAAVYADATTVLLYSNTCPVTLSTLMNEESEVKQRIRDAVEWKMG